jgi:DNA-binding CsgD family transcriptional regulator
VPGCGDVIITRTGHEETASCVLLSVVADECYCFCMRLNGVTHLSEKTERAIEACYDAALATERWPAALQLLGESLAAQSCTFAAGRPLEDPFTMPRSNGHEDFAQLWLRNEPDAPDPHAARAARLCRGGRSFILEQDISTEEERRTLPYYMETARAGNRDWFSAIGFDVEGHRWGLTLYRGEARGPFSIQEAKYAATIAPHLSSILSLAQKLSDVSVCTGVNTLERFRCGVVVVDSTGVATHLNRHAQHLLGADLTLSRGRLAATDPASNRNLRVLIAAATDVRASQPHAHGSAVIYRDGLPWLLAQAMPVTAFGGNFLGAGRAILTLADLTSSPPPDRSTLMRAYGLTAAEARLAARIASGVGIGDAAAALGIAKETARSQLKAVFAKTRTSRQAELAHLVTRLGTFGEREQS